MKTRKVNAVKGICVTICDDGNIIEKEATLDKDTGEIWTAPIDTDDLGCLIEEQYFETEDGEIREEICPVCRGFIMSVAMQEGVGKQLYEEKICKGGCN